MQLASAWGPSWSSCWHNQLAFGDDVKGCTIRELTNAAPTDAKMKKARTTVTVPKFTKTVTFARNDMRDLDALSLGEYGLPLTPNFPTVDSIAGLKKPFCDPKNSNACLVGFPDDRQHYRPRPQPRGWAFDSPKVQGPFRLGQG